MRNCNVSHAQDSPRQSSATRSNICLLCILLTIFLFYSATLRPGQSWGDDFAMYIHHAQTIAHGRAYADTGYIYNPAVPVYGPRSYPPVFPLLLAPLYKLFGLNLTPMKLEQVVIFMLALACMYAFWRRDLGTRYALALVAVLGFNPVFWSAKDGVLSDLPFLLFFYLAALLVRSSKPGQRQWWRWAALIGLTLYLAVGTRAAGIAVIAGLPLYEVIRYRTITKQSGFALTVCAALMLLQERLLGSLPTAYFEQAHLITWHATFFNVTGYARALAAFWVASIRSPFSFIVLAMIFLLTIAGIYFRRACELTPVEVFLVPYLVVIIAWPFAAGIRIAFPFIPWIVFLALTGLRGLSTQLSTRFASVTPLIFLLLLFIPYAQAYRRIGFGPIAQSDGLPEFNQLCNAVRIRTEP